MTTSPKRSADDYLAEFRADPMNAPLALYAGAALADEGRDQEALAVWTLGDDANAALRTVQYHPEANAEMRALSARADAAICEHFNSLHRSIIDELADSLGDENLDRVRNSIWVHYHRQKVEYRTPRQAPMIFYMPDLPAAPVVARETLPWVNEIEESYTDIMREYEKVIADTAHIEPYVPEGMPGGEWRKLSGTLDWAAIYLYYNTEKTRNTDLFPETLAALDKAPLLKKNGAPGEIFFSKLKPGAHIPPHYGLTNTRLTVHLPIRVPEGCSIRVGDDVHYWKEGEIIAFDDSFEHEAWHRGEGERVVLIFETHHPDLSAAECEAIERVYAGFDAWVAGRHALIGMDAPSQAIDAP